MNPVKKGLNKATSQADGPLSRWEKRKQAVLQETKDLQEQKALAKKHEAKEAALPTDEDMPPIESLTADSDYSGFMSPRVSETLRRLALRKLFHSKEFNICDGLDDYDDDFTTFEKLGSIITADMKHQMEEEARKKLQAMDTSQDSDDKQHETSVETGMDSESAIETDLDNQALSESEPDLADHHQPYTQETTDHHTTSEDEDEDGEIMG